MNNIINKDYRKTYNNPYRHGVLIGNYSEDIFGQDLKKQKENQEVDKRDYISEKMEHYQWPELKEQHIKEPCNDLTSKHTSNFDLNIDFTKKNLEDYMTLQSSNKFELQDKNRFLPGQIKEEYLTKKMTGQIPENKDIFTETQKMLNNFHQKDTRALLFTKKTGLVKNLFFAHGVDQKKFGENEYASTYHLTINQKEKTNTIYNSKYKVAEPFLHPPKATYDQTDVGFRKYKHYEEFTKRFDKGTNLAKKKAYQ